MARVVGICMIAVWAALAVPASAYAKPMRIASLNVCTDQLLLTLVARSRIVTVTFLAVDPDTSYFYKKARGIPINYGRAEEVLEHEPDLIVAGRYTAQATTQLLRSLGYRVETFEPAESLARLWVNIERMAKLVGEEERGREVIADMRARFEKARVEIPGPKPVAAVFRANGFTLGKQSLVNDILGIAGFRHLTAELDMARPGFLPLETLILSDPALVIFGKFRPDHPSMAHRILEHPALKTLLETGKKRRLAVVPARLWNCEGPFVAEAVERLAKERRALARGEPSPEAAPHGEARR